MQRFRACVGAAAACLELWAFELDLQRVHKPVHETAKCRHRGELDDFRRVEMFGKLGEDFGVVARFVPGDELGPALVTAGGARLR
jgi:hypothetical protein